MTCATCRYWMSNNPLDDEAECRMIAAAGVRPASAPQPIYTPPDFACRYYEERREDLERIAEPRCG